MLKKHTLLRALITAGLTSGLAACGGSSDSPAADGGNDGNTPPIDPPASSQQLTGQFVDSPVQGLRYETPSKSGVTNANGEFNYVNGEEVTFYIGNSAIGQSLAGSIITPAEMTDETSNADRVTNILRFLQTMDSDGDPSNGITISESTIAFAETLEVNINFDQSSADFEASADPFLSTVSRAEFVSAEDAKNHFEKTLADTEVDIRGEWVATSVYRQDGVKQCEASATWTFTDTGISITGKEMETQTSADGTVTCQRVPLSFTGSYSNPDLGSDPGAGCTAGICTLEQLNTSIPEWEPEEKFDEYMGQPVKSKLYATIQKRHTIGADTMVRIKTSKSKVTNLETGETGTRTVGVSETVFLRKEASEYTKDMRGTWNITATRSACPEQKVSQSLTYTDTHIIIEGHELNRKNGECDVEPMNETISYSNPQFPDDLCGPTCTYHELNGTYSDEGDTIKLSHKRGSDFIFRTKGDSRQVWNKIN